MQRDALSGTANGYWVPGRFTHGTELVTPGALWVRTRLNCSAPQAVCRYCPPAFGGPPSEAGRKTCAPAIEAPPASTSQVASPAIHFLLMSNPWGGVGLRALAATLARTARHNHPGTPWFLQGPGFSVAAIVGRTQERQTIIAAERGF